ncbi:MAG: protein-export chaperone SecB [Pseudomonadota bacterium]
MAEENGAAEPTTQPQQTPPKMQVVAQYIRDMSFENIASQQGVQAKGQPNIQVRVGIDARKRGEGQYEVSIKLNVDSKAQEDADQTLFVLELDYAGVFQIENVPEAQMHPFLMIECPRMIFPFLRRIVHDITRDGGFPPLNLENIDFLTIYRNEIVRRQTEKTASA